MSFRLLLTTGLQPVAAPIADEAARALDAPGLAFGFDSPNAHDTFGLASSFQRVVPGDWASTRCLAWRACERMTRHWRVLYGEVGAIAVEPVERTRKLLC